jgi:hypothetical protein
MSPWGWRNRTTGHCERSVPRCQRTCAPGLACPKASRPSPPGCQRQLDAARKRLLVPLYLAVLPWRAWALLNTSGNVPKHQSPVTLPPSKAGPERSVGPGLSPRSPKPRLSPEITGAPQCRGDKQDPFCCCSLW